MTTPTPLPGFFMNTIPKSGTHLLLQILLGMPDITHDEFKHMYEGTREQVEKHSQVLRQAAGNEMITGHIYHMEPWADMFRQLQMKQIFMIRDLRDTLVSFVHFVRTIPYPFSFADPNLPLKESYMQIIYGIPEIEYPNIADYYRLFLSWKDEPGVCTVTFEDLMVSHASRRAAIKRIAEYLWEGRTTPIPMEQMIDRMEANIDPQSSPTFRQGRIGGWQKAFDADIKAAFKEVAGELLIELGQAKNMKW
ncbi:sulfotransferase domain-containing protein [Paenibacillus sedimenti]|uniref:Sulfotransferase domain-containing protein n=1 Tax=Paenibacillus sedimenti TaxID=2770274 RepID=A0A926KQT5_9BACL|nr:sulfotransferase domain-containing protein [Paenibacillus sedimenti]MBD0381603.1 sulfotransferase domain-containing protein [Paenibacillus sedimenti]